MEQTMVVTAVFKVESYEKENTETNLNFYDSQRDLDTYGELK